MFAVFVGLVLGGAVYVPSNAYAATGLTISGHVFLGTAAVPAGAGDVHVHYELSDYSSYDRWVPTDSAGLYTIPDLAAGSYVLKYTYHGSGHFSDRYWGGSYGTPAPVSVVSDSVYDFTLPLRASVSGTVSLGTQGNHPGGTVAVSPSFGSNTAPDSTVSGTDGTYTLWLNPGFHVLSFSALVPGYQTQYWHDRDPLSATSGTAIDVGTQPIAGIDQTLPAVGSVSGHVWLGSTARSAGAGQVKVTLFRGGISGGEPTTLTDTAGNYVFNGLWNNTYSLQFDTVADSNFQRTTVPAFAITRTMLDKVAPDATLPMSGSIVGQVFLGDTNQPAGAGDVQVYFNGPGSDGSLTGPPVASTDASGNYVIPGLTAGSYTVYYHYAGTGAFADEWWNSRYGFDSADITRVGSSPVTQNVTLTSSGSLSGVLKNGSAPLTDAIVEATLVESTGAILGSFVTRTTLGSSGAFAFPRLTPGLYRIRVIDHGVPSVTGQFYNQSIARPLGELVPVTAGADVSLGDLHLFRGGAISGRVSCDICGTVGSPFVDMSAIVEGRAAPSDPWVQVSTGTLDAGSGGYGASGLFPGEYRVRVVYRGNLGYREYIDDPVTVAAGESVTRPTITMTRRATPDHSGDGLADVLARDQAGGLYLYRGNGATGWLGSAKIGTGWNGFNRVFNVGDFNGDGFADVMARTPSGDLYLYRGNGAGGWLGGAKIGNGWGLFTLIYGVGDFNGDGFSDVMGRTASGDLYVYNGNGAGGWAGSAKIGTGWAAFNSVFGAGDFSGDGLADVMARTPSGDLYLYRGNGAGSWLGATKIGAGWNGFDTIFSVGDFSGDGLADVMARTSGGDLYLYRGDGASGWAGAAKIGTGWASLSITG